jgi:hypothetical protein
MTDNNSENFLISDTKTKMSDSTKMVLKYWYTKCRVYYKCHKDTAIRYDKFHKYMGIPTIVVGIFNTTSIFANFTAENTPLLIINGTASFIATVLVTMQNYYDFGKLANIHLKLANGYHKITTTIEKILMYEKLTNLTEIHSKTIDNIMNQMEYLIEDSPPIPDMIWNQYKGELKSVINVILSNENISKELMTNSSTKNSVNDDKESLEENEKNTIEIVYDNSKQ